MKNKNYMKRNIYEKYIQKNIYIKINIFKIKLYAWPACAQRKSTELMPKFFRVLSV